MPHQIVADRPSSVNPGAVQRVAAAAVRPFVRTADRLSRRRIDRLAVHRPSHVDLLSPLSSDHQFEDAALGQAGLDAIVVPTCRGFEVTKETLALAAELAVTLGARLVVMCSREATLDTFPVDLRSRPGLALLALDTTVEEWRDVLPRFDTAEHPFADDRRECDTATKRNLALMLAAASGWTRVFFLDDDVMPLGRDDEGATLTAARLAQACATLDSDEGLAAVGWRGTEFPDNSVVCHVRRLVGHPQDCFIGAGALLVRVAADTPFFPQVYNEDWLFQYRLMKPIGAGRRRIADAGSVRQRPYDPFTAARAAGEEMGDLMAEGLYQVLHVGPASLIWTPDYWRAAGQARREMIKHLRRHLKTSPRLAAAYVGRRGEGHSEHGRRSGDLRIAAAAALEAALRAHGVVAAESLGSTDTADLIVDFLHRWRVDVGRWKKWLRSPRSSAIAQLLGDPRVALHGDSGAGDFALLPIGRRVPTSLHSQTPTMTVSP